MLNFLDCKQLPLVCHRDYWLTFYRIDDDAALRAKVDEALSVYDDYMKNRSGAPDGAANGGQSGEGEAGKEESADGIQA